jgi:hypothetical protein
MVAQQNQHPERFHKSCLFVHYQVFNMNSP